MALPLILGADIGTQLSQNIRTGRQQEASIADMRAQTRGRGIDQQAKQLEIEEYILNAGRRRAERSLGTSTAESGLARLPSAERAAIDKSGLESVISVEEQSPLSKNLRKLTKQADLIDAQVKTENPDLWKEFQTSGMKAGMMENLAKVGNANRGVYINTFAPVQRALAKGIKGKELKTIYENSYYKYARNRKNDPLFGQLKHPDDFNADTFNLMYGSAIQTEEQMQKQELASQAAAAKRQEQTYGSYLDHTMQGRLQRDKMDQIELAGRLGIQKAIAGASPTGLSLSEKIAEKLITDPKNGIAATKLVAQSVIDQFSLKNPKTGNNFTDEALDKFSAEVFNGASSLYQQKVQMQKIAPSMYQEVYGLLPPNFNDTIKSELMKHYDIGAFEADIGTDFGAKDVIPGLPIMGEKIQSEEAIRDQARERAESITATGLDEMADDIRAQIETSDTTDLPRDFTFTKTSQYDGDLGAFYSDLKSGTGRGRNLDKDQAYRKNLADKMLRTFRNTLKVPAKGSIKEGLKERGRLYTQEQNSVFKLFTTMELLAKTPEVQESAAFQSMSTAQQTEYLMDSANLQLEILKQR